MPKRILCGASARRDPEVLEQHLKTLTWQVLPKDHTLDLCHVDDFTPDQRDKGRALLEEYGGEILTGESEGIAVVDFDDSNPSTHLWQISAFERVAKNKQLLFDKAVEEGYDYVWICDTDLILDRTTLWNLIGASKPVTAAVYWTRWQADQQYVMPQVWLRHPYELSGRGMEYEELRSALANRELLQVWGLGACMLLRTDILQEGKVRYWPLLPELVAAGGMNAGEDRTFSLLCERNHVTMWADAWSDVFHVYRPEDIQYIPKYIQHFDIKHKVSALYPTYGDYVNLQIMPCEDPHIPAQSVRGRIGQLKLLPQLESAVLRMQRGDSKLLSLAFPIDFPLTHTGSNEQPPIVPYRANTRIVEVQMIDHQPYGYAPLLQDEMVPVDEYASNDPFKYTQEQAAQLRSVNAKS